MLAGLAFEFSSSDHAESERKIKRRLREKKLGPHDKERINNIRNFKDDAQKELGKFNGSNFYAGSHGKYADMQDWDFDALLKHMQEIHHRFAFRAVAVASAHHRSTTGTLHQNRAPPAFPGTSKPA